MSGNAKFDLFCYVKIEAKLGEFTDHDQNLISSEGGGQVESACQIWGHSFHALKKTPETHI